MTEHDWRPISPPATSGIMCNACFQCKCCGEVTEDCPGDWAPIDALGFEKQRTEKSRQLIQEWLERKRRD